MPDHNGIKDGYGGACQHDQECQDIQAADRFADDDQGQEGSDKRRDGVVGAGLRRAQVLLRPDIQENAQAVGYEAEHQSDQREPRLGELLRADHRDNGRTQPGKDALEGDDLVGVF